MSIGDKLYAIRLAAEIHGADNKYLAEQRAHVRVLVAALKSLDKDLKSLVQMNDNSKNAVMGFNDRELDKQQKEHTATEAAKEFLLAQDTIRKMMQLSPDIPLSDE